MRSRVNVNLLVYCLIAKPRATPTATLFPNTTLFRSTCKNTPCVQLINVKANVDAACPGAPVTITGTVKNCGTDVATDRNTIRRDQAHSGNSYPGATPDTTRMVNMRQCNEGARTPFTS